MLSCGVSYLKLVHILNVRTPTPTQCVTCAFVQLLLYYVRPACPTSEDTGMLGPGKFPL
jgi:hypothetical protein